MPRSQEDIRLQAQSDAYHAVEEERILKMDSNSIEAQGIRDRREAVAAEERAEQQKIADAQAAEDQKFQYELQRKHQFQPDAFNERNTGRQWIALRSYLENPQIDYGDPENIQKMTAQADGMPGFSVPAFSQILRKMSEDGYLKAIGAKRRWQHMKRT